MLLHKYDLRICFAPSSYLRLRYMNLHAKFLYVLKFVNNYYNNWQLTTRVQMAKISLQHRDVLGSSTSNLHQNGNFSDRLKIRLLFNYVFSANVA